jgi:2-methylcitrate dehydratase PrpD
MTAKELGSIGAALNTEFSDGLISFCRTFRTQTLATETVRRSTDAITDTLACMVLGATQPLEPKLRRALFSTQPLKQLLSHFAPAALRLSSTDALGSAALYLGTLAHAADFDDISHPAYCHATALLLPALLIRGATLGVSGEALIRAHVVGIETLGQLGRRLNTAHYERGWHTTGTFGAIGATAALAFLENFTDEQMRGALGVSASLASGVRQNFGTMTKPLHAGLAARSAILATRLAEQDFTCAPDAIEGKFGFMKVFGGTAPASYAKPWGQPLEIMTETGIGLKAYPCCAATHPAIDAARVLREKLKDNSVEDIESIRVGASRFAMQPLIYDIPTTGLEGKFSMRYCIASAMIDGAVKIGTFELAQIKRPVIERLMKKISVEIDPLVADDHEFAAIVDLKLKSGRTESIRIDVASGKPGNWLSEALLKEKFFDCLGTERPNSKSGQALFDTAQRLVAQRTIESLYQCLVQTLGDTPAR